MYLCIVKQKNIIIMNVARLSKEERLRIEEFPNYCPICKSTNVTPSFDYEHDVIDFHCEQCNNDYHSDEFVECGYCGEKIHSSLSVYSNESGKDYCCSNCLVADK